MTTDRRSLLKGLAAASTVALVPAVPALAKSEPRKAPADAVGLLYDSTRCIGCKTCVVACKKENNLPADTTGYGDGLYDSPSSLNETTKTVIQLAKEGGDYAFVKKQCMHCVDPACTNACMMGALSKRELGIVSWDSTKCIGCRYCQVACPFEVPKFQWSSANPRLIKCELCRDRLKEGKKPACTEVCPRSAVIFGKRDELLAEAHRRLKDFPNRYVQKVYGENDLGGTQVLYLSHVDFEKLGFKYADTQSVPEQQRSLQHGIYKGFAGPVALYALLGIVMFRNRAKSEKSEEEK